MATAPFRPYYWASCIARSLFLWFHSATTFCILHNPFCPLQSSVSFATLAWHTEQVKLSHWTNLQPGPVSIAQLSKRTLEYQEEVEGEAVLHTGSKVSMEKLRGKGLWEDYSPCQLFICVGSSLSKISLDNKMWWHSKE